MSSVDRVRELFLLYGIRMPRRFYRKEKDAFCSTAGAEYQKAGYPVKAIAGKKKNTRAVDVVAGDLDKAKTIVVSNYDTPIHNFGNPFNYYPLNGPSTVHASTIPYYTPMVICTLLAMFLIFFYVKKINFQTHFWPSLLVVVLVFACTILGFFMSVSVGNKINMDRNTSGCVANMRIASLMNKAKDSTAFVLTDYGCSKHAGDEVLRKQTGDAIDSKQVILLDSVGRGDTVMIGYQKGHKKDAKRLAAYIKNAKTCLIHPAALKYMQFSYYPSGLLVTRGIYNPDSQIITVPDTATNSDDTVDVEAVSELADAIAAYLNGEKAPFLEPQDNESDESAEIKKDSAPDSESKDDAPAPEQNT